MNGTNGNEMRSIETRLLYWFLGALGIILLGLLSFYFHELHTTVNISRDRITELEKGQGVIDGKLNTILEHIRHADDRAERRREIDDAARENAKYK